MRIKRGVTTRKKHKKILKQTKGMQHAPRTSIKLGRQAVVRALQYAYRDRRNRKRDFRRLWIQRINAGARSEGVSYSQLMSGLKKAHVELDRKVLSELAVNEPEAFKQVVATAKK